jgi:1-acyl-sn-glycerol-3-phosphate acyltransferase
VKKIFLYPGRLWRVTAVLSVFALMLSVILVAPAILLVRLLQGPKSWMDFLVRGWNRLALRLCFVKISANAGIADYNPKRPLMIVSNHQGLFDIGSAYELFSGRVRMVSKLELFFVPFFGQALWAAGFVPIRRGNKASGRQAIYHIAERLQSGVQLWVAPEGTRSPDGVLRAFKAGGIGVAIDAGVSIQPIVVHDSRFALPKGALLPRVGSTIHVTVLPSISTEGVGTNNRAEFVEKVRKQMAEQLARGFAT